MSTGGWDQPDGSPCMVPNDIIEKEQTCLSLCERLSTMSQATIEDMEYDADFWRRHGSLVATVIPNPAMPAPDEEDVVAEAS